MGSSFCGQAAVKDKPPIMGATRLGRWRFVGLAYTLGLVLVGANLPTPLYRIYQGLFGFSTGVLTVIFVTYVVGVIVGLVVAGRASDRLGRKPVLIPAALAGLAGATAFAIASGVAWLFVGRALTGLTTGVVTSVVPAALVDLEPRRKTARAALVASAVTVVGLACGPMFTAILMQYAPAPTRLVYVCYLIAFIPAAAAIIALPAHRSPGLAGGPAAWWSALRPRWPVVASEAKGAFRRATIAFVSGWVGTALFFSLGPTLAEQVLRTSNNAVIAAVVLTVFVTSAIVQIATRQADRRVAIIGGLAMFAAGMGLVPLAVAVRSEAVFIVAALAVGGGQGLSHRAAQDEITRNAPSDQRAQTVAAFFIAGYAAVGCLIVSLGIAIDHYGLVQGLSGFALVVSALALGGLWLYMPQLRKPERA